MRIGLDSIPLLYSSGADYRTTLNLYRELLQGSEHEYRMLCISRYSCKDLIEDLRQSGDFEYKQVHSPFRLIDWGWRFLEWPSVESLLGEIDIYHGTSICAPAARRAKVAVTVRGIVAEVIPEKLPAERVKQLRKVLRDGLSRADYLFAVSETTASDLVRYMGVDPAKVYVVPHGVDPIFRPPPLREQLRETLQLRFGFDAPYILFVGAIGIHKNVGGLLDAYRELRRKGLGDYHLCFVGRPDSAWDELQQRIAAEGLESCVHHLGWIEPHSQDLVDLYGGASCFVHPSFYEGWCSPPVEAMACGTPVVTSNVSSLPETTGGAAVLIDPYDSLSIAEGVASVLTDKELREQLIEKGFRHAARMNWKRAAGKAMKAYDAIYAEGR